MKFLLLLLGCLLLTMAFVPLVQWGVFSALVNFHQTKELNMPTMVSLIGYNLVYTFELATGILCIKKYLK